MTTITVKIVGVEGDSVLVKYASENSAKPIDEYDAVAYQPKTMGFNNINDFVEAIKPGLLQQVERRDAAEQSNLDLSLWVNHESISTITVDTIPVVASIDIPSALDSQIVTAESEVKL